ncbi:MULTISPECIES: hypothetical protein [Micromonospora]|uniref:hypothetical protein n=1 Tax=Micromonospora TaxID=1873 RepID=UPI001B35E9FC|nr:hypothetical protein [Micromonospora sp. C51]MBQ1052729.1 hypothetical protein [Micromonospora sp. C51]
MLPAAPAEVPHDVTDVLLWRMAMRVTADHQPDPHRRGRCVNLRCVHEVYPCPPLRDAQRAQDVARRPRRFASGRAQVPAVAVVAQTFVGWFRPTRPAPAVSRSAPMRHPVTAAVRLAA